MQIEDFMENNYVTFNQYTRLKYPHYIGAIKNKSKDLYLVFGRSSKIDNIHQWHFKLSITGEKFLLCRSSTVWHIYSNTNDICSVKYFLQFIADVKKAVRGGRSTHKSIPIYDKNTYMLKGKISLYRVPPIKSSDCAIVYDHRANIPTRNKFSELIFTDHPEFTPNLTPKEVLQLGSFGGTYYRPILSGITGEIYTDAWKEFPTDWFENLDIETQVVSNIVRADINKYGVKMGGNLDMWESSGWINELDPYGWFQWYCRFYLGRRSSYDDKQIRRWQLSTGQNGRFRITLMRKLIKQNAKLNDINIGASGRQGLQHWAYFLTKRDLMRYLANFN